MVWKDDRNDSLLLRQSIHVPAQAWVVHKEGHDDLLSSCVRDDRVGASKGHIPEEVENARVLREGMYICLNVLVDKLGWNESVAAPVLLMKLWLKGKRGCPRLVGETLAAMKAWLPASWRKMDGATGHACGSMLSLHRAAWISCGRGWCSHATVLSIAWAPWGQKRSRAFLRWDILALCRSDLNEIF